MQGFPDLERFGWKRRGVDSVAVSNGVQLRCFGLASPGSGVASVDDGAVEIPDRIVHAGSLLEDLDEGLLDDFLSNRKRTGQQVSESDHLQSMTNKEPFEIGLVSKTVRPRFWEEFSGCCGFHADMTHQNPERFPTSEKTSQ